MLRPTMLMVTILGLILPPSLRAQWAVDDEPYGLLGCKFLRFRGLWEQAIDTVHPDESIEGVCLAVAVGSIVLYNKFPLRSHFDGAFITCGDETIKKPIDHTWRFSLITGNKGRRQDCDRDDPELRTDMEDSDWSGIDEIRRLVYVTERSYGFSHECFRSDGEECGGSGYHPLEHVLKNRFGYTSARALGARRAETKKQTIQSIRNGVPVIAMKCDHAYILDGFMTDPQTGEHLFHSCDYVLGEGSMGWYAWKHLLNEGLERVIVGLSPTVLLPKGPSTFTIRYRWGDMYVPATSHSKRRGYLTISHRDGETLGEIGVTLRSIDNSPYVDESSTDIAAWRSNCSTSTARFPAEGTFPFVVGTKTDVVLQIHNRSPEARPVRVEFHDFVDDGSAIAADPLHGAPRHATGTVRSDSPNY